MPLSFYHSKQKVDCPSDSMPLIKPLLLLAFATPNSSTPLIVCGKERDYNEAIVELGHLRCSVAKRAHLFQGFEALAKTKGFPSRRVMT